VAVTRVKIPKPTKTGTPKGMEGVRPGSPKAIAAGYKAPKGPGKPGGAPFSPSFNADGTTTLKPPTAPAVTTPTTPAPTTRTVTTPGTPPTASWWQSQYTSDPSFLLTDPSLRAAQNQTSSNFGYRINRDVTEGSPTKGQAYYRAPKIDPVTKKPVLDETGKPVYLATGILQTFDDAGKPVYKDSTGKVYAPSELEMDIQRIAKGEAGYLEGALGGAEATSEKAQFNIGDVAARAGARRSGMRAQASAAETGALQSALAGLTQKAAGELTGIDKQYADLYSSIFRGLAPKAEALAAPTTAEVPVAPSAEVVPPPAAPNTNPVTESGLVPRQALSGGPQGQFMGQAGAIVAQRDAPYAQKVASLNALKRFALTPQQLKWISDWIENNKPKPEVKPKPKPAKGKGK